MPKQLSIRETFFSNLFLLSITGGLGTFAAVIYFEDAAKYAHLVPAINYLTNIPGSTALSAALQNILRTSIKWQVSAFNQLSKKQQATANAAITLNQFVNVGYLYEGLRPVLRRSLTTLGFGLDADEAHQLLAADARPETTSATRETPCTEATMTLLMIMIAACGSMSTMSVAIDNGMTNSNLGISLMSMSVFTGFIMLLTGAKPLAEFLMYGNMTFYHESISNGSATTTAGDDEEAAANATTTPNRAKVHKTIFWCLQIINLGMLGYLYNMIKRFDWITNQNKAGFEGLHYGLAPIYTLTSAACVYRVIQSIPLNSGSPAAPRLQRRIAFLASVCVCLVSAAVVLGAAIGKTSTSKTIASNLIGTMSVPAYYLMNVIGVARAGKTIADLIANPSERSKLLTPYRSLWQLPAGRISRLKTLGMIAGRLTNFAAITYLTYYLMTLAIVNPATTMGLMSDMLHAGGIHAGNFTTPIYYLGIGLAYFQAIIFNVRPGLQLTHMLQSALKTWVYNGQGRHLWFGAQARLPEIADTPAPAPAPGY